jgi:hypothetical protein
LAALVSGAAGIFIDEGILDCLEPVNPAAVLAKISLSCWRFFRWRFVSKAELASRLPHVVYILFQSR